MFPSFFIAGFEGSTGYNAHGRRIDSMERTGHDKCLHEDYALIRAPVSPLRASASAGR